MKDWNTEIRQRVLTDKLAGLTYVKTEDGQTYTAKCYYEFVPNDVSETNTIYILMNQLIGVENFTEKNGYNGTVSFLLNIVSTSFAANNILNLDRVVAEVKKRLRRETFADANTNFKIHSIKLTNDQSLSDITKGTNIYRRLLRYELTVEQINYTYL